MARTVLPRYGRNRSNNRATHSRTELSPASNASSSTQRVRGNACGWNSPSTNPDWATWTASDIAKLVQRLVGQTGKNVGILGERVGDEVDGGDCGAGREENHFELVLHGNWSIVHLEVVRRIATQQSTQHRTPRVHQGCNGPFGLQHLLYVSTSLRMRVRNRKKRNPFSSAGTKLKSNHNEMPDRKGKG